MIQVLFIGEIKDLTPEYEAYNDSLYASAKNLPGFLGIDSDVKDGIEITISKWKDRDAVMSWAKDPEHMAAKARVYDWYNWYRAKHFNCVDDE